ncbi:MAG TPA: peptide chain release factor 1 [Caldisericia bacterium]|jgi:peptide chain release factor 1|nr:peptide chain release factor 1 [Caldisericia bacterium]
MLENSLELKNRYKDIIEKLSSSEVLSNQNLLIKYSKEEAKLKELIDIVQAYEKLIKEEEDLMLLKRELDDPIFEEEIDSELSELQKKKEELVKKYEEKTLPEEPFESNNVIMEIRAAAGGEEAALFAAELFRMYTNYAISKGWKIDIISSHPTGLGGFKEVIFEITGSDVYRYLMFESGVHRVQRVPETESSGRVHTSTITVAVMPEAEEALVQIKPEDLKIETFKAGGHGGQNVQKNETAVRITHIPTGITVSCQDERSQLQNRERALKVLMARLLDIEIKKKNEEEAKKRRSQIGWGERSEKIRTYNFPQNRVTDHRIGLTLYNLTNIMNGELDELISNLRVKYDEERKKELVI